MPRLTKNPSRNSRDASRAMSSRVQGMSGLPPIFLPNRALFDALFITPAFDDTLHEYPRSVDGVGIERAHRHDLLHLRHRHLAGGRHHRVEIARRQAVDEIAFGLP